MKLIDALSVGFLDESDIRGDHMMRAKEVSLALAVAALCTGTAAFADCAPNVSSTTITAPVVLAQPASTAVVVEQPAVGMTLIEQARVLPRATAVSGIEMAKPAVHLDLFGMRLFGFGKVDPDIDMR
jgi:hypothetical protein